MVDGAAAAPFSSHLERVIHSSFNHMHQQEAPCAAKIHVSVFSQQQVVIELLIC